MCDDKESLEVPEEVDAPDFVSYSEGEDWESGNEGSGRGLIVVFIITVLLFLAALTTTN